MTFGLTVSTSSGMYHSRAPNSPVLRQSVWSRLHTRRGFITRSIDTTLHGVTTL